MLDRAAHGVCHIYKHAILSGSGHPLTFIFYKRSIHSSESGHPFDIYPS